MGVFHVFKIVQMVPNRATHHILTVHGKQIPEGNGKFLILIVLKSWAEFDEDVHCKGSFLIWPVPINQDNKTVSEDEVTMETRDTRKRPQKLVVLCETSGKK